MRKILISILVCLLLIGSAFFMVNGISKLNIKGIKAIDEKNSQINQKISDLSNAITVTYANTESNLNRAANTLQNSKTEYENQAALSDTQNPSYVSQLEAYDIDYLWTKLGNYARNENVVIKIEVVSTGTSKNLYTLNFTVTGNYVNITDFIYDIENDSKLGFKIDEFKMGDAGDNKLMSTFVCKEIPINVGTIDKQVNNDTNNTQKNTNGTENTNSTGNSTTNTTGNGTTNTTSSNTNTSGSVNTTGNSTTSSSSSNTSSSSSSSNDIMNYAN